jgi:hypothetical protein
MTARCLTGLESFRSCGGSLCRQAPTHACPACHTPDCSPGHKPGTTGRIARLRLYSTHRSCGQGSNAQWHVVPARLHQVAPEPGEPQCPRRAHHRDGGSTDGTVESARARGCTVITGKDAGIYDALNRGPLSVRRPRSTGVGVDWWSGMPSLVVAWLRRTAAGARGGAPAATRGRTTLAPARSGACLAGGEGRRWLAHSAHPLTAVVVVGGCVRAPSLIWVRGPSRVRRQDDRWGVPECAAARSFGAVHGPAVAAGARRPTPSH